MSRLPLSDRPCLVFPAGLEVSPTGYITAPLAVLVMAKDEGDTAGTEDAPPARPGLARCLPDNVIALRTARRSA